MGYFLKCDAEGCSHIEDVEGLTQEMVGRPCPKCGESLLTQEDFDGSVEVFQLFETLKGAVEMLKGAGLASDKVEDLSGEVVTLRYHYHDGETNLQVKARDKKGRG